MVEYFITVGRGLEKYALQELFSIGATVIDQTEGKVFFTYDGPVSELTSLNTAERLFLAVFWKSEVNLNGSKSRVRKKLQKLLDEVTDDRFIHSKHFMEAYVRSKFGYEILSKDGRHVGVGGPHGKKSRVTDGFSAGDAQSTHCTESKQQENNASSANSLVQSSSKRRLVDDDITFRISCKVHGTMANRICSKESIERYYGRRVAAVTGWSVGLRQPPCEYTLHIQQTRVTLGVFLVRLSHCEEKHVGLRSTVAAAMVLAAGLRSGDRLLDPCCGSAQIIRTAQRMRNDNLYVIGSDLDQSQLDIARRKCSRCELVRCDVTQLPFSEQSVDAVLCDLPFGQKHLTVAQSTELIPGAVREMSRVLVTGGRVVLLVAVYMKDLIKQNLPDQLSFLSSTPVSLGNTDALIIVLSKTNSPDTNDLDG